MPTGLRSRRCQPRRCIVVRTIDESLDAIGAEYASADAATVTEQDRRLWARFARYNASEANILRRTLTIIETDNPEPYASSIEQSADIGRGVFYVSRAFCTHPVWTVSQNVDFRIAHDILGHHAIGGGFDRAGEIAVYRYSLGVVPAEFHAALFTESIGQLAYAVASGDFGPQKVFRSHYFGKVI